MQEEQRALPAASVLWRSTEGESARAARAPPSPQSATSLCPASESCRRAPRQSAHKSSSPSCHADLLPCRPSAMPIGGNADVGAKSNDELSYDTRARGDFRLGARCEGPGPVLMPFSQGASLSCRPFTMPPVDTPARGLHGGSDRATDAARPVAPARCSPLLAARPELTTAIPTHPCHAAFLPCRISSASPPAEPLHRSSIAQSHAVARAGAGDSSPHGSSHAALVAHVAPQPTHPINVAPLPCRPCAAPPPVPSFHTADWLPQATAHVPARSGRQQIHAGERASGGCLSPQPWDRQRVCPGDCTRPGRL